jgi:hypothetical protein
MRLVKFTAGAGAAFYVNPSYITAVYDHGEPGLAQIGVAGLELPVVIFGDVHDIAAQLTAQPNQEALSVHELA